MGSLISGGLRDHHHPIAGGTDYAEFEADGTLVLHGAATYWEDLRVAPNARTQGDNAPVFEKYMDDFAGTSRGIYAYSFDDVAASQEKEVFFQMQLPHAWKLGSDISVHVHWVGTVADTDAAPRWGLEYSWAEIGAVYPDTTTIYTVDKVPAEANVVAWQHYLSEFAHITPGAGADGLSSILMGRLFRNSSNVADTYNAGQNKCGLLFIDAHIECDRLGSRGELTP
jgi:hypothetical protein